MQWNLISQVVSCLQNKRGEIHDVEVNSFVNVHDNDLQLELVHGTRMVVCVALGSMRRTLLTKLSSVLLNMTMKNSASSFINQRGRQADKKQCSQTPSANVRQTLAVLAHQKKAEYFMH